MVEFRGRVAIRNSERQQADEKNSGIEKQSHWWRCVLITLVFEVSSTPGPFQIKGSGTQILPFAKGVPPAGGFTDAEIFISSPSVVIDAGGFLEHRARGTVL